MRAAMVKQLYEWFFLKKKEIKKKQKNISSELLESFGRQLTERNLIGLAGYKEIYLSELLLNVSVKL